SARRPARPVRDFFAKRQSRGPGAELEALVGRDPRRDLELLARLSSSRPGPRRRPRGGPVRAPERDALAPAAQRAATIIGWPKRRGIAPRALRPHLPMTA